MLWPDKLYYLENEKIRPAVRQGARHYVYILFRPDRSPFYIGKGVDDRCLHHEAEARTTRRLSHKLNLIRSLHRTQSNILYCIDSFHDSESDALSRERFLIAAIGRHDQRKGPLTNQTDGGEGASNPSEESRQRRRESLWGENAEDEDRQIANRYFGTLASVHSVTLKPGAWRGIEGIWRNRAKFPQTERQAASLVASAIANRVLLEPGAKVPRRLHIEGVEFVIENGVGRDILSSDTAILADDRLGHEIFQLTPGGLAYILAAMDNSLLLDAGILNP